MSNHHTYKKIELVGSSPNSIDEAIQNAITECARSVNHLEWFEVVETRGHIVNNQVAHFQVTVKIGFRIENS
jgi:flavin-binding protein dodecin